VVRTKAFSAPIAQIANVLRVAIPARSNHGMKSRAPPVDKVGRSAKTFRLQSARAYAAKQKTDDGAEEESEHGIALL